MSDPGFAERPKVARPYRQDSFIKRLRQTADNGQAVRNPRKVSGSYAEILRAEGLRMRQQQQADGTVLAWCERIEPAAGERP